MLPCLSLCRSLITDAEHTIRAKLLREMGGVHFKGAQTCRDCHQGQEIITVESERRRCSRFKKKKSQSPMQLVFAFVQLDLQAATSHRMSAQVHAQVHVWGLSVFSM